MGNSSQDQCMRLLGINQANTSQLFNASKTCGPAGEFKRRIAEELSAVWFVGGWDDWPKAEGDTVEVHTANGTFTAAITEENYNNMKEYWARGCGCEQAKSPLMKGVG